MPDSHSAWHIVFNPHAGSGRAGELTGSTVKLLRESRIPCILHETRGVGDAGRIGTEIVTGARASSGETTAVVVVVVGGDGTLHELINGIKRGEEDEETAATANADDPPSPAPALLRINVVLVPAGTANAVYHSFFPSTCTGQDGEGYDRMLSVCSAISSSNENSNNSCITPDSSSYSSSLVPLSVAAVRVRSHRGGADDDGDDDDDHQQGHVATTTHHHSYYSHVVTSTALHAHILETASSPEMRKAHPGVERFRIAAERHFGTLYPAELSLFPVGAVADSPDCLDDKAPGVQRWSPSTKTWEAVSRETHRIRDNFTYLVAALVDRFEPKFRIAPLSTSAKDRPANAIDIVVVRARKGEGKDATSARLLKVLNTAYQDGQHVQLTERDMEKDAGEGTRGERDDKDTPIVEYYRVAGFTWQPVSGREATGSVEGFTLAGSLLQTAFEVADFGATTRKWPFSSRKAHVWSA